MPLIVICGIPSCGKTTLCYKLNEYFTTKEKNVIIISEEETIKNLNLTKNEVYSDSKKEKQIRSSLKSQVERSITPDNVVIIDGLNYIKGYRYELYCLTKSNKSTQCTIHCYAKIEDVENFNQNRLNDDDKYSKTIIDSLMQRFEEPDGKNRWDSPLFMSSSEYPLDFDSINECLFSKKPPPPNKSTENVSLSSTNFLYELDRSTQTINDRILSAKQLGVNEINFNSIRLDFDVENLNIAQLTKLRRQFINFNKMHPADIDKIPSLYCQFLKSSLNL